jgi:hypothetical protein
VKQRQPGTTRKAQGRTSRPAKPKRVGMYELSYFVRLMQALYTEGRNGHDTRFWQSIETYCPNLMQAIDAQFLDEWRAITFTRDITTPASWGVLPCENYPHEKSEEVRPS